MTTLGSVWSAEPSLVANPIARMTARNAVKANVQWVFILGIRRELLLCDNRLFFSTQGICVGASAKGGRPVTRVRLKKAV
jgi:hypothetical protein